MSDRDGLAGSHEAPLPDDELEAVAQAAFGAARAGGGVSEMAGAMLPELRLLAARVRAEAVAEERQRIAAGIRGLPLMTDRGGDLIPKAAEQVRADAALLAAGSVPVATPPVPTLVGIGEAAAILGVTKARIHQLMPQLPEPAQRLAMGPVWTEASIWNYAASRNTKRGPVDEGKPGHDIWPNSEAGSVAEPSVGTGTPAEQCGCTACTPDGPIDGKCRCDVCIRSAIWHPESTCTCRLCRYAHSLRNLDVLTAALGDGE